MIPAMMQPAASGCKRNDDDHCSVLSFAGSTITPSVNTLTQVDGAQSATHPCCMAWITWFRSRGMAAHHMPNHTACKPVMYPPRWRSIPLAWVRMCTTCLQNPHCTTSNQPRRHAHRLTHLLVESRCTNPNLSICTTSAVSIPRAGGGNTHWLHLSIGQLYHFLQHRYTHLWGTYTLHAFLTPCTSTSSVRACVNFPLLIFWSMGLNISPTLFVLNYFI